MLILVQAMCLLVGGEMVVRRAFAAQTPASTGSLTVFAGAAMGAAAVAWCWSALFLLKPGPVPRITALTLAGASLLVGVVVATACAAAITPMPGICLILVNVAIVYLVGFSRGRREGGLLVEGRPWQLIPAQGLLIEGRPWQLIPAQALLVLQASFWLLIWACAMLTLVFDPSAPGGLDLSDPSQAATFWVLWVISAIWLWSGIGITRRISRLIALVLTCGWGLFCLMGLMLAIFQYQTYDDPGGQPYTIAMFGAFAAASVAIVYFLSVPRPVRMAYREGWMRRPRAGKPGTDPIQPLLDGVGPPIGYAAGVGTGPAGTPSARS